MKHILIVQIELCEPSQRGGFRECLHPQNHTVPDCVQLNCTGTNAVFLWLPSQKGWRFDSPHAHHQ
jgi:hypothetical protein